MTYISFSYEIVNDIICFLLIYQVIEKKKSTVESFKDYNEKAETEII